MQPNTTTKPIGESRYAIKVLLTITAVSLLVNYVETMVIPGVPTIQKDFAASETIASWVTSAFLIVGAAVAPLFGKLGDIYGKKKILLIVLTFYIVGVGLAGFSNSIYMLILSRAIQGIGFAIVPLGLALIADIFPREKVATAQGIISGTFAIGAAAGLVIGAYVVQDLGWQWAFHTAFILSIILFLLVTKMLKKDPPGVKSKVDYAGATILMSGIVLVLLYLTEAPNLGWLGLENIALLIPGIMLTIVFFVFENRRSNQLIQLKLLKIRNVLVANLVGILSSMSMFLLFFAVIYYAQQPKVPSPYGLGLDVISTGLTLAPATLVMLIVGPLIGRLVGKIGPKPILLFGSIMSIIGLSLFILSRGTTLELTIDVAVSLVGVVSLIIPIVNMISVSVPKDSTAVGLGMNTMLRNLGGAIGPVLATTIMSTYYNTVSLGPAHYNFANATAFNTIFAIGIGLMIVIIALSLAAKNYTFGSKKPRTEENSKQ